MIANSQDDIDGSGGRCLTDGIAALPAAGSVERRHEQLMEWAVADGRLERQFAERAVMLAEEESLEPVYALLLIRCGIGVQELEPPAEDGAHLAAQPTAPEWVEPAAVDLDDVVVERRLRSSFRRFRAKLETAASPEAAVRAYLAEPDVGRLRLY